MLTGRQGPLLYVAASAAAWDGVPITLYHPARGGRHVSALYPGVLAERGLGHFANAAFAGGWLRAEGWFDVAAVRARRPGLLPALAGGQRVELSTGLFTRNEPAWPGATHGGRPYAHVARDYGPDHLAILPDHRGACSLATASGSLTAPTRGKTTPPPPASWRRWSGARGCVRRRERS